jgi:uncharacterized protein DUF6328
MGETDDSARDGRNETELERLDRNQLELLNELRVAGTGIQVLLAFLLVVPFNNRFLRLTRFERADYFATLVAVGVATVLLIAPSIHHRLLFRHAEKPFLVATGNRLVIVAMAFLTVGLTGIFVLITDVLFGGVTVPLVGAATFLFVGGVWFVVPLRRLRRT